MIEKNSSIKLAASSCSKFIIIGNKDNTEIVKTALIDYNYYWYRKLVIGGLMTISLTSFIYLNL